IRVPAPGPLVYSLAIRVPAPGWNRVDLGLPAHGPTLLPPRDDRERDPHTFSRAFPEPGAQGPRKRAAGAEGGPQHALHLGRNAAAPAVLPGLERSARAQARNRPEMLPCR